MGRKSTFTQAIADAICARLAEGESLRSVCRDEKMPCYSVVRKWEVERPEFAAQSMRAREIGCHAMADECLEIADDARNDWMTQQRGEDEIEVPNHEHVQRSRLRIDTRLRLLGKWLPKVYGEKVDHQHAGSVDLNHNVTFTDPKPE